MLVDGMFGEGIARGTPFLSSMVIMASTCSSIFLGPAQDPKPPASRGVENLKRAPIEGARRPDEDDQLNYRYGLQVRCSTHRARGATVTSATPQLLKKVNYRHMSADGTKRDQPGCKSTTLAMCHTLATTRGSS